jgi:major membrane immunogen (membrane-anchored lipoprotein)
MKRFFLVAVLPAALLLAACGERDQTLRGAYNKSDGLPWQGAHDPFVAKGWSPGDKTSWENQLRERGQRQNEYVRINN